MLRYLSSGQPRLIFAPAAAIFLRAGDAGKAAFPYPGPDFSYRLTTKATGHGIKKTCFGWQGQFYMLCFKYFLLRRLQDMLQTLFLVTAVGFLLRRRCLASQHPGPQLPVPLIFLPATACKSHPDGSTGFSVPNGKNMLAVVPVKEIAFAQGTAGKYLEGIYTAGICLHNGYQFFVAGSPGGQFPEGDFSGPVANGQARAGVPVESHSPIPISEVIIHFLSPPSKYKK
ncbi:flagellar hook capping protein [Moorella thermoacetica Y72]|uniref:Flagellar hook capping protein n=1 Tax=Moorella thermoacetica Y72 TaxID=1325331 RepID=A0A0S6UEL7_NEOTH|nr:flagellar hook capping protein [Moorella thermoacetica Y72]